MKATMQSAAHGPVVCIGSDGLYTVRFGSVVVEFDSHRDLDEWLAELLLSRRAFGSVDSVESLTWTWFGEAWPGLGRVWTYDPEDDTQLAGTVTYSGQERVMPMGGHRFWRVLRLDDGSSWTEGMESPPDLLWHPEMVPAAPDMERLFR